MVNIISQKDFDNSSHFSVDIDTKTIYFIEGYDHANRHTITPENKDEVVKMMELKRDEMIAWLNESIESVKNL